MAEQVVDTELVERLDGEVRQAQSALAVAEQKQAAPLEVLSEEDRRVRQLASLLYRSGFFPGNANALQAAAKILAGRDLDIPPTVALNNIHIVQGRISLAYPLIVALIKRSRRYNFKVVELTNKRCELDFYERWDNEWVQTGTTTFTIEEAVAAGLTSRGGPDSPWRKYTKNMLFARAVTNMARTMCADIFMGAVYTPEELGGDPGVEANGVEANGVEEVDSE